MAKDRLNELQHLNRTARALAELIAGKTEYEGLYGDLRIMIETNEARIFEILNTESGKHERDRDRIHKALPVDIE